MARGGPRGEALLGWQNGFSKRGKRESEENFRKSSKRFNFFFEISDFWVVSTTDSVTCYGQFPLLPDSGGDDALSFFQIDPSTPCTVSYKLVGVNYMLDVPNHST